MSSVVDKSKVPWWVSNLIVPLVNLILAQKLKNIEFTT